ncbi:MAG: hypothetical protein WCH58_03170 [Candidatus Saccharibacteria bacterium]
MSELFVSYLSPGEENAREMLLLDHNEYINCGIPIETVEQLIDAGDESQINDKIAELTQSNYGHLGVYGNIKQGVEATKNTTDTLLVGYIESNNWDNCNQEPLKRMFGAIILQFGVLKFEGAPYVINSLVVDNDNSQLQYQTIDMLVKHAINKAESRVIYSILNQGSPTAGILTTSYGFQNTGYSGKIDGVKKILYKRPPYINVMVRVASFSFMQRQCSVEA